MVEITKAKSEFFKQVMVEGVHYGPNPGGTKPTLLKPGAELLFSAMGMTIELSDEQEPLQDFGETEREGHLYYRRRCQVYRQGILLSQASGSCSSREEKYRWREGKRVCPECGKDAIIKGKSEYGGGWLCFKKKGGCGAKFDARSPAITQQETGKVVNPNLADLDNTILKMADKRAYVAACLLATGCSDIFTQDVGDDSEPLEPAEPPAPASAPPPVVEHPQAVRKDVETIRGMTKDEVREKIDELLMNLPEHRRPRIISDATNGRAFSIEGVKTLKDAKEVLAALLVASELYDDERASARDGHLFGSPAAGTDIETEIPL